MARDGKRDKLDDNYNHRNKVVNFRKFGRLENPEVPRIPKSSAKDLYFSELLIHPESLPKTSNLSSFITHYFFPIDPTIPP